MSNSDKECDPEIAIESNRLILCEGSQDQAFFRHLISDRNLPSFDVVFPGHPRTDLGGTSGFGQMLEALSTNPGFRNLTEILVVADNDDSPPDRFNFIAQQIGGAEGFTAPQHPLEVARAPGVPPLVVMMIPWVDERGALETLCLESAYAESHEIRECITRYAECTSASNWSSGTSQDKMRLRCILSSRCEDDPNTGLAFAWSKKKCPRLIPLNHGCFDRVASFLANLDAYIASH